LRAAREAAAARAADPHPRRRGAVGPVIVGAAARPSVLGRVSCTSVARQPDTDRFPALGGRRFPPPPPNAYFLSRPRCTNTRGLAGGRTLAARAAGTPPAWRLPGMQGCRINGGAPAELPTTCWSARSTRLDRVGVRDRDPAADPRPRLEVNDAERTGFVLDELGRRARGGRALCPWVERRRPRSSPASARPGDMTMLVRQPRPPLDPAGPCAPAIPAAREDHAAQARGPRTRSRRRRRVSCSARRRRPEIRRARGASRGAGAIRRVV